MKIIYLDNGATTKVDERVVKKMEQYFLRDYGNASSMHLVGQEAKNALDNARNVIKKKLNAKRIIFTSGGSESDNLAIKGVAYSVGKGHIITSKIEHPAVLRTCEALEKEGFSVTYLDVNKDGLIDPKNVRKEIKKDTILVSIMAANNEIGVIEPIEEIGRICNEKNVIFHTDAVQAFTKMDLDMKKMNIDLLSISGHKIHGPKGVGALAIGFRDVKIKRLIDGGGQEFKLRAGTENVPGAVGLAEAAKLVSDSDLRRMEKLRDKLINGIEEIPGARLNGSRDKRLVNNVHFSFKGIEGEAIAGYLFNKGICVSTGSACATLTLEPSHVLLAIGLDKEIANGSLRITLSKFTTEEEINIVLRELPKIINKLRRFSPLWK